MGEWCLENEESFLFIPPHHTVNTLKTILVLQVLDFHHASFTVLSAQARGSRTKACLDQRVPEREPVISLLLGRLVHPLWSLGGSLQHRCKVSHRHFLTLGFTAHLLWHCRIKHREKTEGHNFCCFNSLGS